ncbi:MAG: hypothetical protein JNM03_10630 [Sphingopyxis sp.]|uniref:hypothetical protein n=1 Tax=Sphingopyxis sp. TaxID=1908224 RepID=UPI001A4BAD7A|nr:hypothetical protein [Sphingopyxis sp.]MBL9070433.1 hypothetical protein [Sphingopyxis sp.]
MSDWQVGDRAICVTEYLPGFGSTTRVSVGRIYQVEGLYISRAEGKYKGVLALVLVGVRGVKFDGFHHGLFRKIDDHVPDEFDREVIEQMKSAPVVEPV